MVLFLPVRGSALKHGKQDAFDLAAIDREIAEIDYKIKEFQALAQRRVDLITFKQLAQRLFFSQNGHDAETSATTELATGGATASLAFQVLASTGALDISGLLLEMRKIGYTGSGDDAKDRKRIYAAIYKNEHFERDGEKWSIKG